jgi:hypothetical protein
MSSPPTRRHLTTPTNMPKSCQGYIYHIPWPAVAPGIFEITYHVSHDQQNYSHDVLHAVAEPAKNSAVQLWCCELPCHSMVALLQVCHRTKHTQPRTSCYMRQARHTVCSRRQMLAGESEGWLRAKDMAVRMLLASPLSLWGRHGILRLLTLQEGLQHMTQVQLCVRCAEQSAYQRQGQVAHIC